MKAFTANNPEWRIDRLPYGDYATMHRYAGILLPGLHVGPSQTPTLPLGERGSGTN